MSVHFPRGRSPAVIAALAAFSFITSAHAAEPIPQDDLPPELRQLVQAIISQPRVSPGVAFGSPIGFGASQGDWFVGLSGTTADESADELLGLDADGSMSVGAGFGNPRDYVGVEAAINIISLTDDFAEDGTLTLKVHRNVGTNGAIAIGTENAFDWGDAEDLRDATTGTEFISYSHYFQLRDDPMNPGGLMLTVGVGDGRLGQVDDPEDIAPFVSVGYNFTRQLSGIVDYAGEMTNVGFSVVPWRDVPLSLVIGATDVTEERGDTEFAFGIGYTGGF